MVLSKDMEEYMILRRKMLYRRWLLIESYRIYATLRMILDTAGMLVFCTSIALLFLLSSKPAYVVLSIAIISIVLCYLSFRYSLKAFHSEKECHLLLLSAKYSWPRVTSKDEILESKELLIDHLDKARECIVPVLPVIRCVKNKRCLYAG